MILSERHGFIFIKTQKTAGTSIEVDLSPRLEPEAIVTRIEPEIQGHQSRNFFRRGGSFHNHMPATRVRKLIGADRFSRLFSFCVEREPIAKCVSHFHMRHVRGLVGTWDEYVNTKFFPLDAEKYTAPPEEGGGIMVNRILRYETLLDELIPLLASFGIPDFKLVSRAKSEFSQQRLVAAEDITDAHRTIILDAFRHGSRLHGLYPEAC